VDKLVSELAKTTIILIEIIYRKFLQKLHLFILYTIVLQHC